MKNMKKLTLALMLLAGAFTLQAQDNDVVDIAISSEDHTTLVAAVKAAGLVETLKGDGPFTVFAPTNQAFENLPDGTVEYLLKPENKEKLSSVLTYHVVSGNYDAKSVVSAVKKSMGKLTLTTVQGKDIIITLEGKNVVITDAVGNTAKVTATDLSGSNGTIHVIDAVLMPM
jgi:uncharacterized surface protein with fasciclin (FAS1) repeats